MVGIRAGITAGFLILLSIATAAGVVMSQKSAVFALSPLGLVVLVMVGWWALALIGRESWAATLLLVVAIIVTASGLRSALGIASRDVGGLEARSGGFDIIDALKLGVYSASFLLGTVSLTKTLNRFSLAPGILLLLYLGWIIVTIPFSTRPLYTTAMAFALTGWIGFSAALNDILPTRDIIRGIRDATAIFCLLSLFYFVALPSIGQMESLGTIRLIGIGDAPNAAGQMGAVLVISVFVFFYSGYHRLGLRAIEKWWMGICVFSGLSVLVLAQSRGALIAFTASIVALLLQRWRMVKVAMFGAFLLGGAGAIVLFATPAAVDFVQGTLTGASRSGNFEELASLAGRKSVWELATKMIMEAPIAGYGYGAGSYIIAENYTTRWGHSTSSAHNAFLQTALDLGFVGTALFVGIFVWSLVAFFRRPSPFRDAIFVMMFLTCLLESAISKAPSVLTLLWIVALLVPTEEHETQATPVDVSDDAAREWRSGESEKSQGGPAQGWGFLGNNRGAPDRPGPELGG